MYFKSRIIIITFLLMLVLAGCGGNGDEAIDTSQEINEPSVVTVTKGQTPDDVVIGRTIRIGNLTDLTGPGANGMSLVNMALKDLAKYYNENDIIPGIEFEIVEWDGQMNSSRTVPGYEWLLEKDVDILATCAPGVAVTLKPRLEADNMVLFTQIGEMEAVDPPGNVFCLASIPQNEAYTFLKWIAENDWDYESNGPAKIGAAAWKEPYANGFVEAMEDYAEVHPEQFEFVGGYLTDFTFDWSKEIELLKNCDYVFPPIMVHGFAKGIRNAGSTARLIGGVPHTAFFPMISNADAWPDIDGMLFVYTGPWWLESGDEINFSKMMVNEYHPEEKEYLMKGSGYQAIGSYRMMFDIVAQTVENAGIEGFNSEALLETAQSWSYSWDERPRGFNYSPEKRFMIDDLCIQEASAELETMVRNDPNWYPILSEP